jgi:hypothetical protein
MASILQWPEVPLPHVQRAGPTSLVCGCFHARGITPNPMQGLEEVIGQVICQYRTRNTLYVSSGPQASNRHRVFTHAKA